MTINNKFELGEIVYLKTDEKQLERIVTKLSVSQNGICYLLSQGVYEQTHFECEISKEKNFLDNRKQVGFNKN